VADDRRTHLDLFSGIGGFSLASNWAGYRTIGFCEIDEWCQRVLRRHWPDVPVWGDVRTLDADTIEAVISDANGQRRHEGRESIPQGYEHVRGRKSFSAVGTLSRTRTLDLITAGYPCQPFSLAGQRLGAEDDRHLWPEVRRLLAELRPARFLGENVAGHISMGLDDVLSDLEEIGYSARPVVIPACAVNAPHRRDRVWIVGHATGTELQRHAGCERAGERVSGAAGIRVAADTEGGGRRADWGASGGAGHAAQLHQTLSLADAVGRDGWQDDEGQGQAERNGTGRRGEDAADAEHETQFGLGPKNDGTTRRLAGRGLMDGRWRGDPMNAFGADWEDGVPRVVATERDRVNKLKALGNAIVPQVAYQILMAMEETA